MDSNFNKSSNNFSSMNKIKVMIVDDQAIIREGLSYLLSGYDEIEVLCEASDGATAIDLLETNSPDVILMDIRMPEINGVEATKVIKEMHKNIKVIIFTTFDDDEYIMEAMSGGASGYLLKDTDSKSLVQAIQNVHNGNIIMPGAVFQKLAGNLSSNLSNSTKNSSSSQFAGSEVSPKSKTENTQTEEFTQRESDIVRLILEGKSNKEISEELFLTIGTTKNYLSQIYMKLQVNDRANAIIKLKNL